MELRGEKRTRKEIEAKKKGPAGCAILIWLRVSERHLTEENA